MEGHVADEGVCMYVEYVFVNGRLPVASFELAWGRLGCRCGGAVGWSSVAVTAKPVAECGSLRAVECES